MKPFDVLARGPASVRRRLRDMFAKSYMRKAQTQIRRSMPSGLLMPNGYQERLEAEYFEDSLLEQIKIVHQPDVYDFAAYLAEKYGCTHIVDIGCGRAHKLAELHPRFSVIGIDIGSNIEYCRRTYDFGEWIEWDLESSRLLPISPMRALRYLLVCADVIEHLRDPINLLTNLSALLQHSPALIITTPDRVRVRGKEDLGPPGNPSHVREWCLDELVQLMTCAEINVEFAGFTLNNDRDREKKTALVVGTRRPLDVGPTPAAFGVTAIMTAHNEGDIVAASLERIFASGIDVYFIDNWSSDQTYQIAGQYLGRGVVGLERFPKSGPDDFYRWRLLLERVEEIATKLSADWFIHHDVDEIRTTPWKDVTLRDALYFVDRAGYNAIDHTVAVFHPVDDTFRDRSDFESHLPYFEFGGRPGHFQQVKAWKNLSKRVDLASSGGHEVDFEGRIVFPFKFLIKHYPIRSLRQGLRKVAERKARLHPEEAARGWHMQYDKFGSEASMLRDPQSLHRWSETFWTDFLVERLSGVGIPPEEAPRVD